MQEIDILWLTAGLSCDGESIAMTAATQPSIEELVLGAIPWIPKVRLHNPVSPWRTATSSCAISALRPRRKLGPFILVVEGSIPDETNKEEGYWASFGTDPVIRAAHPHLRLDRPPGAAKPGPWWRPEPAPPTAASMPCREIHRLHGASRLSGLGLEVEGRHPASSAFPAVRSSRTT